MEQAPVPSAKGPQGKKAMMLRDRIRVAVIVGSTREGRFGDTVARWLVGRTAPHSDIDVDLAEAELPAVHTDA